MTDDKTITRIPWRSIESLGPGDRNVNGPLEALDALRTEWDRRLGLLTEEERIRIRQRSLRKLAIETGILERLYEVDWGLTLTLVAEGFTRDVVERAGGNVDDRTLATLRAQLDTLSMVLEFVHAERSLSSGFIKELHQAITRTQDTYVATDSLGRIIESQLPKGEWKRSPNHVLRQDNTLSEYAPAAHVQSEIDRLVTLWSVLKAEATHPIIKAAWLHHRFVQIHPFADGNGRVARALTLLVLEQHHYAPLVVDRWHRPDYLKALDSANEGNLQELVRLFVKLEGGALTSELERPEEKSATGLALDVAHTLADQLAELRKRHASELQKKLEARAIAVLGRMKGWFEKKGKDLAEVFNQKGLKDTRVVIDVQQTPSEKAHWYRHQIIESAHTAGHYADFSYFAAWCRLRVRVENLDLRFVASLHGAGRDIGVMAVTTFGELAEPDTADKKGATTVRENFATTKDAFRFVHTESADEIGKRSGELEELLEEGLAVALTQLLKNT